MGYLLLFAVYLVINFASRSNEPIVVDGKLCERKPNRIGGLIWAAVIVAVAVFVVGGNGG